MFVDAEVLSRYVFRTSLEIDNTLRVEGHTRFIVVAYLDTLASLHLI